MAFASTHFSVRTNPHLAASLQSFSRNAGLLVAWLGVFVLCGWLFGIPVLKSVIPGLASMKANTALGFVAGGTSLWLLQTQQGSLWRRRLAHLCAALIVLLGALSLSEYVFGVQLGIDQLLFNDDSLPLATLAPGRMAPTTAWC